LPKPALQSLLEVCEVEIWDQDVPPPYEVITEKLEDKEALLCLLTDRIDAPLMDAAPRLKVISQCAVGYDNIDVGAATARGIPVGNTPGVLTDATADFAFTLLMAAARRIGEAIDYVREGRWQTWGLTLLLGESVYGATLGIVGMGRIGQALARRARGFDMKVLYYDAVRQAEAEAELGVEYRTLEDLLRESDFVSLHVSLTEETTGLMDARTFARMKPTAILINTSRGPVVEPEALYQALKHGQIAYAALDVTDPEPLPADHKLLTLPNLIVAPHIASATVRSRNLMASRAVENLIAGLRGGRLPYCVNPEVYD
jgi:glyoxylate reductase